MENQVKEKTTRIYGEDMGGYGLEHMKDAEEWEMFLIYYEITLVAWRIRHDARRDYNKGYLTEEEFIGMVSTYAEMTYPIAYCVYVISKKIGIKVSEPTAGKYIETDREQFMKWYDFYKKHFVENMSRERFNEFQEKRKAGKDISEYLPKGSWRDS